MFSLIRLFDVLIAVGCLVIMSPLLVFIFLALYWETGSPIFFQQRMGRHKRPFVLIKFRTMLFGTPSVPSHLASRKSITRLGKYFRLTKLDELPQLWNVIVGEMSLVGPRPNLMQQHELIAERDKVGIYKVRPGITGLAQILGIDMSRPRLLARLDNQMIKQFGVKKYFFYLMATLSKRSVKDHIQN